MAPFAQAELQHAGQNDQVILLGMDQTNLGDRMAVLMITLRVGAPVAAFPGRCLYVVGGRRRG
ncbi:MAG: hypothetical protein LUQ29_13420 [Methylococcaceae bacterium]|nr:hypothetical protein [Methylococcaceae bacterium]